MAMLNNQMVIEQTGFTAKIQGQNYPANYLHPASSCIRVSPQGSLAYFAYWDCEQQHAMMKIHQ